MEEFFSRNPELPFYLRKGAGEDCYGKKLIFYRYIGIHRGFLNRFRDRIRYAEGREEILPGVFLPLPHTTRSGPKGKKAGMYVRREGCWHPDCFDHEQSLVLNQNEVSWFSTAAPWRSRLHHSRNTGGNSPSETMCHDRRIATCMSLQKRKYEDLRKA